MIAPQTFNNYPEFGEAATKCCPNGTKYANGYIQGDVLPAEHLNWFLSGATLGISMLQLGVNSLEREMQTILTCAGQTPQAACFDQVYNAMMYKICNTVTTWASPKNHAATSNTYGLGNAECYGHLKISDTYTSTLSNCANVAASQKAVSCVYQTVLACKTQLGNTVGCALGTASAGTANTAARSDHVHPIATSINFGGATWKNVATWGNQTGTMYGGWDDACGGSVAFRCNNPESGKTSMIIDGTVYVDEGRYPVLNCNQVGSAAYCAASCFRPSTWTPTCVACAGQAVGVIPVDAANQSVAVGTKTRVVLAKNQSPSGYVSRTAIGNYRCASSWACGMLSVGCNDGGTDWYDYLFSVDGVFTAKKLNGNITGYSDGTFVIKPGASSSHGEGLRVNYANNGYAILKIGTNDTCAVCGFSLVLNCSNSNKLYLENNGLGLCNYFEAKTDKTVVWHGNVCGTAAYAVDATYACSACCANNSYCFNGYDWLHAVIQIRDYKPFCADRADCADSLRWHTPILNTDFKVCGQCLWALKDFMFAYNSQSGNSASVYWTKKDRCFLSCACCSALLNGVIFHIS